MTYWQIQEDKFMGGDRQAKTISKDHKEGRLNMTEVKAYNKIRLRS